MRASSRLSSRRRVETRADADRRDSDAGKGTEVAMNEPAKEDRQAGSPFHGQGR